VIYLFTDFGSTDLYVGQVKAVLAGSAAGVPVIDLLHDAPAFDIAAGAHLLWALAARQAPGSVTLAVIDPGVGTSRRPVVVRADERWFVGPDNGLLSVLAARSSAASVWEITWRPESLSRSFHGRDLFAPIAARIATQGFPAELLRSVDGLEVSLATDDLAAVIYVDHYGNAMTGIRGKPAGERAALEVSAQIVHPAPVFAEAPVGKPFWYVNSIDLVEIAVDRGSAARQLGIGIGDSVRWIE
jgi:S-adenosylmethionine hydrolase